MRPMRKDETESPEIVDARLTIDRDMSDIGEFDSALAQAIIDRIGRKPSPMLDPAEAFFLRRGNDFSIDN
jgi:hypothetical protein